MCRWVVRGCSPPHLPHSSLHLHLHPGGTASGLRVKEEPDPPGLLAQERGRWVKVGRQAVEEEGVWDVVGEWGEEGLLLRLLPRLGGALVVLRGEWGEQGSKVATVRMEYSEGRAREGLEMVQQEGRKEEEQELVDLRASLANIKAFFKTKKLEGFTDLTLVATDGAKVETSKLVVVTQCEYFRALYRQEEVVGRVHLPCNGATLTMVVEYLVTGEVDLGPAEVQEVMELADYLGIEGLLERCEEAMVAALDTDNCLEVWGLAGRLARPALEQQAVDFLLSHLQAVLSSPEHHRATPPHLLHRLLASPALKVFGGDGAQVWGRERSQAIKELVEKWGEEHPEHTLAPPVVQEQVQEQVQEYMVERGRSLGRPIMFTGGRPSRREAFRWVGGARVRAVTLAWRPTNWSPVLTGLAFHWSDLTTDTVGHLEGEELEVERQELEQDEHFTLVLGADSRCIEQLNFVPSLGRVLGPELKPRTQSSFSSLLASHAMGDAVLVGLQGMLYSTEGAAILAELQFIYQVSADVTTAISAPPVEHYRTPNFLTVSREEPCLVQEPPPPPLIDTDNSDLESEAGEEENSEDDDIHFLQMDNFIQGLHGIDGLLGHQGPGGA